MTIVRDPGVARHDRFRVSATVSQGAHAPSYRGLYKIKGGLRPPAGCARLAPLAVLAGQLQEHGVEESAERDVDELLAEFG